MDDEILYEVVKKLIGNINPAGDASMDDERFENLKLVCSLVDKLLSNIDDVAYKNKDSYEFSVKRAAEYASDFYNKLGIVE